MRQREKGTQRERDAVTRHKVEGGGSPDNEKKGARK